MTRSVAAPAQAHGPQDATPYTSVASAVRLAERTMTPHQPHDDSGKPTGFAILLAG